MMTDLHNLEDKVVISPTSNQLLILILLILIIQSLTGAIVIWFKHTSFYEL